MVDLHCHLLPGLDDGPKTLEAALEMAEIAIADGITHVVATPHANARYPFLPELVRQRQDEIQARVAGRLTVYAGCDFHLSYENLQDIEQYPEKYTINRNGYLLAEFAEFSIPPAIDHTLHRMQLAGIVPVITHPERNRLLRSQHSPLDDWIRRGFYVQVTAGAFLGRFGESAQEAVEDWLAGDRIHFVASDGHNTSSRPPRLREAFERVAELRDEEVAQALFEANPMAAVEGRALPYAPELPLGKLPRGVRLKTKKRFWFF
jgi:protein-tyrosine phosphatase